MKKPTNAHFGTTARVKANEKPRRLLGGSAQGEGMCFQRRLEEEEKSAGQTPSACSLCSAQVGPVARKLPAGTRHYQLLESERRDNFLHAGPADEASLVVRLECHSVEYIMYMEDPCDSVPRKRLNKAEGLALLSKDATRLRERRAIEVAATVVATPPDSLNKRDLKRR